MFGLSVKCTILIFIYISGLVVKCDKHEENDQDTFVAKNEWQEIKEGQKVPSGLHYRINLQTGKKEAKTIVPGEETRDPSFVMVKNEESENTINSPSVTEGMAKDIQDELKKAKSKAHLPNKYRNYEEIKHDLESINLIPQSESEMLQKLFQEYEEEIKKNDIDEANILRILQDFIYMAHQYDNAIDFVKLNGFNNIIYRNLNSTTNTIRQEALRLFSSLVQNNSKVKIHAVETSAVTRLLKLLSLDPSVHVKNRAATALSCLLRTFPFAQISFVENGGLNVVSDVFKTDELNLKLKLATLMSDLLTERENDKSNFENHKNIDLENLLIKMNWCDNLNSLLEDLLAVDTNDHDSIEKCLIAMHSILNKCQSYYDKQVIKSLHRKYEILSNEDTDDTNNFFTNLAKVCEILSSSEQRYAFSKTEL